LLLTIQVLGYLSQYSDWAAGCTSEESCFDSQHRQEIFVFVKASRLVVVPTQLHVLWVTGAVFLAVKWLLYEADHSTPSGDNINNAWNYTIFFSYLP
jgi:hypothetical protein